MEQIELTKESFENKSTPIYSGLPDIETRSTISDTPRFMTRRRFRFTAERGSDPPQDKFQVIHDIYNNIFTIKITWDKRNRICRCGHDGNSHASICMTAFCRCNGYRRGNIGNLTGGVYTENKFKRAFRYFF